MIFLRKLRLSRLRTARDKAQKAYGTAVERGDTRAQHHAFKHLRKATHDLMRLEVKT